MLLFCGFCAFCGQLYGFLPATNRTELHLSAPTRKHSLTRREHLLRTQLADERHCRFMIHWVRRYLVHPPPVSNATPDELVDAYLGQLRKEDLKEWQFDQARQSITAWRAWCGGRNTGAWKGATPPAPFALAGDGRATGPAAPRSGAGAPAACVGTPCGRLVAGRAAGAGPGGNGQRRGRGRGGRC